MKTTKNEEPMKAPFRISFNRLRLVGGDHKQIRGKQASNQYQQNNLWPFPSTPMNSILNIKKRTYEEIEYG